MRPIKVAAGHRRYSALLALIAALGWVSAAQAESLDDCREARKRAPAEAMGVCTQALQSAVSADDAFEARMHLVELHTTQGDLDAATAELALAEQTPKCSTDL